MTRKIFSSICLLTAMLAASVLGADDKFCRSGEIVGVERLSAMPQVAGFTRDALPEIDSPAVFVVVKIKADANRVFSIVDYQLEIASEVLPCAAINAGDGFTASDEDMKVTAGAEIALLFEAHQAELKAAGNHAVLVYRLSDQGRSTSKITIP